MKKKGPNWEQENLGVDVQIYIFEDLCLLSMLKGHVGLDKCLYFFETITSSIKCQEHLLQKAICGLRRLNVHKRIFQTPKPLMWW